MPRCTRKGCGLEFEIGNESGCFYHPLGPVFHEGLKSWACCADVNKPVMDFDDFIKIPGCTKADQHTLEVPIAGVEPKKSSPVATCTPSQTEPGKEVYTSKTTTTMGNILKEAPPVPIPVTEEDDDLSVSIKLGEICRRNGCKTPYVSDEFNRHGSGEGTICTYHPGVPIFREGSKGYLCCKRRVLEFDDFLKIPGCKTGRHLFCPPTTKDMDMANCRIDHYQTVDQVHVTIFAKQVDKLRSVIHIHETRVDVDLYLPLSKRFSRSLNLFGLIDPSQSSHEILNNKVELHFKKQDRRSWTMLEKTDKDTGNINFTFGVGGRTGTVGAKDLILDEANMARTS